MRTFFIGLIFLFPPIAHAQDSGQEGVRLRASAVGSSVQSSALQEVGPWGAAALPDGLQSLSSDLWRGADPITLGLLLERIGPDQRFPSLQALTRQAVFSGGSAPTPDPDVTRKRFEAASRLGPADAAARLVFGVPRLASDANLAGIAIDAGLRVGRIEEACGLVEAITGPASGTNWLEARAACYALNEEPAAANLSVDLAKSRGLTDAWLSRAVAAVAGPLTAPPPFRTDSGRATALSLRAKLKPPVSLVSLQEPSALSALVTNSDFMTSLAPQERTLLARKGAERGVIPVTLLASYQPIPDAATAFLAAPAQITQRILMTPSLALRALEARSSLEELKSIMATQPGLMTLTDVPILTEAAIWAGEGALAASIAALSPSPLDARLALVVALYDPAQQANAISQRMALAPIDPVARRTALRDSVVAWAAGLPAGQGLSLLAQTGLPWGPAGNSGMRAALDLASSNGSKGEVILLAALALQGIDPAAVEPETLTSAVKALRRVGLSEGARDLARDYLLATYVTLAPRGRPNVRPAASPAPAPARTANPPAPQPGRNPITTPRATRSLTAPAAAPTQAPAQGPAQARPLVPTSPTQANARREKPSWGTP